MSQRWRSHRWLENPFILYFSSAQCQKTSLPFLRRIMIPFLSGLFLFNSYNAARRGSSTGRFYYGSRNSELRPSFPIMCATTDEVPLVSPLLNSRQLLLESDPDYSLQTKGLLFYLLPFFVPLLGFVLYDPLALLTRDVVIALGHNGWAFTDGGQYKAEILAPTINGVVVPTISIALATLVAGTLSSLRERQNVIRACLNNEGSELKTLHAKLLHVCRGSEQMSCISLIAMLGTYISRVLSESSSTVDVKKLSTGTSELHTMMRYLYAISEDLDYNNIGSLETMLSRLNALRSTRITALQNVFPFIHWAVITLLGSSILLCFMLETDQDALKFLDGTQLRILFTFLMGAVSSTALLCFDLSQPFTYGFFAVPLACMKQLVVIRNEVRADVQRLTELFVQSAVNSVND